MSEQAPWWPDLMTGTAPPDALSGGDAPDGHGVRSRYLAGQMEGLTVFTLSRLEQLLLWSARRWRHGRFRWDQVEAEFRRLLPDGWMDLLLGWEEVLELLHRYPMSQPDIGNGCTTVLSGDERALLTLLAALQRSGSLSGDLLLRRLVPPAQRAELRVLLSGMATCLDLAGSGLPLRCPVPTPAPQRPLVLALAR